MRTSLSLILTALLAGAARSEVVRVEAPSAPIPQLPGAAAQSLVLPGAAAMPGVIAPGAAAAAAPSQPVVLLDDAGSDQAPETPTLEKARSFNAAGTAAGVLAEIGAAQNTASYFFDGKQAA